VAKWPIFLLESITNQRAILPDFQWVAWPRSIEAHTNKDMRRVLRYGNRTAVLAGSVRGMQKSRRSRNRDCPGFA